MGRVTARRLVVGMLLVGLVTAWPAGVVAQTTELPPAPVPVAPATPPPVTLGPVVPAPPPSAGPVIAPSPLGYQPPPTVIAPGPFDGPVDPGPNGWAPLGFASDAPGWFFNTQVAMVLPKLKFDISNDAPLPKTGLQLHLPAASLDSTVMPAFEFGYGLGASAGFFALNYAFLMSEGTGNATVNGVDSAIRSRLNLNVFNFDYGTTPYEFSPRWEMAWRIGIRVADVFFDSQAQNSTFLYQASNSFLGAGPHAQLDLERRIVPVPGLALYGRVDGAALIGQVQQKYQAQIPPGSSGIVDTLEVRRTQLVPAVTFQAGLSYRPPDFALLKLTTGYEYSQYFNAGRLGIGGSGEVSSSAGSFYYQGWFLRAEVDF
ncbi:MAG: Lpg1974 family pore-forming outer membrane protein [Gemmataceae bacterium]